MKIHGKEYFYIFGNINKKWEARDALGNFMVDITI